MRGDFDEDEIEDERYYQDIEDPYCHRCDNKGTIIVCVDDMCRGAGECMHGDGEIICPDCKGENSSLTEAEMLIRLHAECMRYPSDSLTAQRLGVSRGHLCHVLKGRKPITESLALAMGYERQVFYRKRQRPK